VDIFGHKPISLQGRIGACSATVKWFLGIDCAREICFSMSCMYLPSCVVARYNGRRTAVASRICDGEIDTAGESGRGVAVEGRVATVVRYKKTRALG